MSRFIKLWIGQLISIIGSGMTTFALGIHVYTQTGKVEQFGLLFFVGTLPNMIITPFSGALADKVSKKKLMLIGDIGAALGTLFLAYLFWNFETPYYPLLIIGVGWVSFFGGLQTPAFQSAVTQLVPKKFLPKASGMLQLSATASVLISPVLAGIVFAGFGMKTIFIIDFGTFFIGVILLLLTKIPRIIVENFQKSSLIKDIKEGLNYLFSHESLVPLFSTVGLFTFLMGFLIILIGPFILSIDSPEMYGIGQSISASGMLLASIYLGAFGIPKKVTKVYYISFLVCGLGCFFIGLGKNFPTIIIPTFIFFFSLPFINGAIDYFLRSKVEENFQGRIFSLVNLLRRSATLLSSLIAGTLVDRIFEPLFQSNKLPDWIYSLFGTGPGKGIGFLLSLAGLVVIIIAILVFIKRFVWAVVITNHGLDYEKKLINT